MKYIVEFSIEITVEAEDEDTAIQLGRDTINSISPRDFILQDVTEEEE